MDNYGFEEKTHGTVLLCKLASLVFYQYNHHPDPAIKLVMAVRSEGVMGGEGVRATADGDAAPTPNAVNSPTLCHQQ